MTPTRLRAVTKADGKEVGSDPRPSRAAMTMMMTIKLSKNMKTKNSIVKTTNPNTVAGRLRTACATRLLPLLLLLTLPAVVQAQFNYTNSGGTVTITSYYGSGGAVTIPSTINGLPVTKIGDRVEWPLVKA